MSFINYVSMIEISTQEAGWKMTRKQSETTIESGWSSGPPVAWMTGHGQGQWSEKRPERKGEGRI